ncbi:uncharacterized protein NESG_01713 [Nematocida ausubeli]|uniref:Uncharacterized protein n=1 Tax=Nematocida ausubeli (strain ATCC PRA-371 / ERTm2) TaxID=1913371 RepID=A0A086J0R1_NEMA1|nr:uncharacterized protein NESG_01713 [Nematocida ausubeli]KFG25729.1 hypothetical protein NESG_01713 [Nematocida ausubeli]
MNSTEDYARVLLTKSLTSLVYVPIEEIHNEVVKVAEKITNHPSLELFPNEFISLISLLNQRPSYFLIISIFQILSAIKLTNEQISVLLTCYHRQMPTEGEYSLINWSFLETPISIKRNFIRLIGNIVLNHKIPKGEPAEGICTSFDVVQILFFLFDDENKLVRLKSYKYACKIIRREKNTWSPEEKKKYRRLVRNFGKEGIKVLKNEHKAKKQMKEYVKIKKLVVESFVKIKIRLGRSMRKGNSTIRISISQNRQVKKKQNTKKELKVIRKNTVIYIQKEEKVVLEVLNQDEVIGKIRIS